MSQYVGLIKPDGHLLLVSDCHALYHPAQHEQFDGVVLWRDLETAQDAGEPINETTYCNVQLVLSDLDGGRPRSAQKDDLLREILCDLTEGEYDDGVHPVVNDVIDKIKGFLSV